MKRLIAAAVGLFGLVAYVRRRRRPAPPEVEPADELRARLAEKKDEPPAARRARAGSRAGARGRAGRARRAPPGRARPRPRRDRRARLTVQSAAAVRTIGRWRRQTRLAFSAALAALAAVSAAAAVIAAGRPAEPAYLTGRVRRVHAERQVGGRRRGSAASPSRACPRAGGGRPAGDGLGAHLRRRPAGGRVPADRAAARPAAGRQRPSGGS